MARSAIDVDDWVTRHPIAAIAPIAGIVALSTFLIHSESYSQRRTPIAPEWVWYAVEGTQELVVDRADLIPPIERDG